MFRQGITFTLMAASALALGAQGIGQTPETTTAVHVAGEAGAGPGKNITMAFRTESMMDAKPVKGSPFCATITSDHSQAFADGNRIHTTEDSQLCRDSQGRTRREAQLNLLGAVPQGGAPKIITIEDPVAGVRYTLDTLAKVARKMPLSLKSIAAADGAKGAGQNVFFYSRTGSPDALPEPPLPPGGPGPVIISKRLIASRDMAGGDEAPPATENLGDQTFAGIRATGTRVTTTIPAGKMGNEQPINVVSENWYSSDLKATVMTKHTDPWAGTLTTQFSNVSTSEPDASLFTVPSDYKVVDEKAEPFMIKIQPQGATTD